MRGSPIEVLLVFLKLGVTSFGGPIAHLGYFRDELVPRRRWVRDDEYGDLVALCQALPGPASSQVGFALGLRRAGAVGALAAIIGFTLPSAVIMIAAAAGAGSVAGPVGGGIVSGLQIVAVAVVAQAVWGMARSLTPDRRRAAIALVATLIALLPAGSAGQVVAIAMGAVAGVLFCRGGAPDAPADRLRFPVSRPAGWAALSLFAALMIGMPAVAALTGTGAVTLFDAFFRSGALVFGGGHVVLPLLEASVVQTGWVAPDAFLAGYGVAQAIPGPLFTFAGYLGALSSTGPGGVAGAVIALAAVFLPGFLLLIGVMPWWNAFRSRPWSGALLRGTSAAVVGILAAALYDPVFTTAVVSPITFALAATCFVLLTALRLPPWVVVIVGAVGGALIAALGL